MSDRVILLIIAGLSLVSAVVGVLLLFGVGG